MSEINATPFNEILAALLDKAKPFPARFLQRFSDPANEEIEELKKIWMQIDTERKANLIEDLVDISESETVVCFDEIGKLAIADPDVSVRLPGVELLESSEDYPIAVALIKLMKTDPNEQVRAESAFALGKFVYLGEVEDLSSERYERIMTALFVILRGNDAPFVRRKALESLGFSSHDDIPDQISKAFESTDKNWRLAAIIAMGHSADDRWAAPVLSLIHSSDEDIQYEAIRAVGELELKEARLPLLRMIKQKQDDRDLLQAIVFSLAKIGGENVRAELDRLFEEAEDDEEADFIEKSLEELDFTEEFRMEKLLEVEPPDEEDLDSIIDIESEDTDEPDEDEE